MHIDQIESNVFKITLDETETAALDEISTPYPECRCNCLGFALSNRFYSTLNKFKKLIVE